MGNTYRSPLRGAAIIAVAVLLPGCIPWPVSMALSGLSYAATGKSISDHFLSSFVQQDCNVGRAVLSQSDICQDTDTVTIAIKDIDVNQALDIAPASGPNPNGGPNGGG